MHVNQLKHFAAVVESGSYAAGAKRFYLTAPAISRSIKELEKELGVKLLERAKTGAKPTQAGMAIYEKIKRILGDIAAMKTLARSFSQNQTSKELSLAIATLPLRGTIIPNSALRKLNETCSDIEITTLKGASGECLTALWENSAQAAIVLGWVEEGELTSIELFSEKLILVASTNHPLFQEANGRKIANIYDFPVAHPSDLRYCYPRIKRILEDIGIQKLNFQELPPSKEAYFEFLEHANGMVFVSKEVFRKHRNPKIRPIDLYDKKISIPICFVYRKNNLLPEIEKVRDHLADFFPRKNSFNSR